MADALLVVPPLFKTLGQPLLGPAMLAGAAHAAGHRARLLDLNHRLLAEAVTGPLPPIPFVGDHDRPSSLLSAAQRDFARACAAHLPVPDDGGLGEDPALTLMFGHAAVRAAARGLTHSPRGRWALEALRAQPRPDVLGVSVFTGGQVLFGLLVSAAARSLWPGVTVVWGGPHVTALAPEIGADPRYGAGCVDAFVVGYAERTWVDLLDAVHAGAPLPAGSAGSGPLPRAVDDPAVVPDFGALAPYRVGGLTLPAQASRGCAYGRCTYCTYPAVEGGYRPLSLDPALAVVALAERERARVAFKDSLLVPARLQALAREVGGRVPWAACTKLHPRLDSALLGELAAGGCHTLELGLETLTEHGQLLADKRQALPLFLRTLDAAGEAGVALVINTITGFPGGDPVDEARWQARVHAEVAARPGLVAKVEHNTFQLERRAPLARDPRLRVTRAWPWSSVLAWAEAAATRVA